MAFDNEMVLDKVTRKSTYYSRIKIDIKQIVSDYFNDKSVLEVFLVLKTLCRDICNNQRNNRV